MDLSHPSFRPDRELLTLPADVAALAAGVGASTTAEAQRMLDRPAPVADRFHPASGSFDAAVAAAFRRWSEE